MQQPTLTTRGAINRDSTVVLPVSKGSPVRKPAVLGAVKLARRKRSAAL